MDVPQAYIHQRLQLLLDLGKVLQDRQRVCDRGLQQIGDGVSLVLHRQRLVIVALAAADFAKDVNVREKIHLDTPLAFALASFATSAGNVEGEASRLVAALARFRQHGIEVANLGEDAGVSRGIRTRRAPNRRLVNLNDLVDELGPGDRLVPARLFARAVERLGQRAIKNVVDQRRLARSRDAGHQRHHPQRKTDIQVLQIVLVRAENREGFAVWLSPRVAIGDLLLARDVLPGERAGLGLDLLRRAAGDDFAAVAACAGAEVNYIVRAANRVLVVLDYQHRVAQIAQRFQRLQQPAVVAMMQADRRLIEDVQHPAQLRSNLRGQADALAFAAAQGHG